MQAIPVQYLSIAVTAIDLLALTTGTGALVCRLWLIPGAEIVHETDVTILVMRVWRILGICVAALTLSSFMLLLVRTAIMSGRSLADSLPMLPQVMLQTHFGQVCIMRFIGLGFAWLGWFWGYRSFRSRAALGILLVAVILIAASRSASGHAADAGDFTVAEAVDCLHIFMVSALGGAVVVVSLVILPAVSKLAIERLAMIARRLSLMAGVALAGVVVTGVFNAWRELGGSLSALRDTAYGELLSIKLLLVAAMVVLGALNRYRFVPRLRARAGYQVKRRGTRTLPFAHDSASAESKLHRHNPALALTYTISIEAILALGILAITAMLVHAMPPNAYLS